eukprot:CAMPEP_0201681450 /NCGR_PEP_ID=MMETSP0494-20130426/51117_1 /ASSEMBLY_ACC=CAM_ASM_000839 /TAXON_ID=420259 /ORGANISM="Thalassiosira gravida, Strain GMp14c1" /LENGTH=628 /DNA_ID=CAMNT_0048165197 /DNA_START=276 /DNA_END=2162 /DNA_ORIENTATION=-
MTGSNLMSPNSIDSMANFTADNCNASTKSEDIVFMSAATTDAADSSSKETQKQLIDINAMTPEEEILKEEKPEPEETKAEADGGGGEGKSDEYGDSLGLLDKDKFAYAPEAGAEGETSELAAPAGVMLGEGEADNDGLNHDELNELKPKLHSEEPLPVEETKAEADAATSSEEKQKKLIDVNAMPPEEAKADAPASSEGETSELAAPAGVMLGEGENDNEGLNQDELNGPKPKLLSEEQLDSSISVDSWGGSLPSLSVEQIPQRSSHPDVPTIAKDDINIKPNLADGSSLSPQDPAIRQTWSQPDRDADAEDDNHDVNFINFGKLTQPSSSEYYYSASNRNTRQMLEKVKTKKQNPTKNQGGGPLEDSMHSRLSHVNDRRRASRYQGPECRMKNGSRVKSIVKNPRSLVTSSSTNGFSVDSTPSTERDAGEVNKPKTWRCKFATVNIREHERVAGDNPCVTSGVPLSIGWGFYQHPPIDLDDYELNKGPSRDKIEMMVPASVRRSMLRDEFGVSVTEMNAAMKEVNITKRRRRHTVGAETMEGWQEATQSVSRKLKRFIKRTSTVKQHENMWASARESAMMEYLQGEGSVRKSLDGGGVGKINNGPKIAPANCEGSPPIEISFPPGEF